MAIRITPEGIGRYDDSQQHHLCRKGRFDTVSGQWEFECPDGANQPDPAQFCIGCEHQTPMAKPKPEAPGERHAWRVVKQGHNKVKTESGAGFSVADWDA